MSAIIPYPVGTIVSNLFDERDDDADANAVRVTPAGSHWRVDTAFGDDRWISCPATGAAITPTVDELQGEFALVPFDVLAVARRILAGAAGPIDEPSPAEINVLAQAVVILGGDGTGIMPAVSRVLEADAALQEAKIAVLGTGGDSPQFETQRARLPALIATLTAAMAELRTTFEKELNHG